MQVQLNVLPVIQLETRPEAVLGFSNGLPDQVFALESNGLSAQENDTEKKLFFQPLKIKIADEEWEQTADLSNSLPNDRVFQLDAAAGRILFGNGINGRIPAAGEQIYHLPYRQTKGSGGNLTSLLKWRIADTPVNGESFGTNPEPLQGGEDAWDLDRLLAEGRRRVIQRRALLSNPALQEAALALPGFAVARADVLKRYHPAYPNRQIPGARGLVVTPWRTRDADPETAVPQPYLDAIANALANRRVLGERLSVVAPRRVRVRVEAELLIEEGVDTEALRRAANIRLNQRLTDIAADTPEGIEPWPLGRPVTTAEIKALLVTVPGVVAVQDCRLAAGDGPLGREDIRLQRDQLAVGSAGHQFIVKPLQTGREKADATA